MTHSVIPLSVFSKPPLPPSPFSSSVESASSSFSCLREYKADYRSVNSMAKFGSKCGQKRTKNAPDKYGKRGASTKKARTEEPVDQSPPTSPESENVSPAASEDFEVYREPSMYDNLLSTLKSGSKSLSDAYRRRQRQEEGRSDSEEDESDASSHSDEDASDDDDVDEFPAKLGSNGMLDVPEETEGAESESDNEDIEAESNSEASDSGEENTVEVPSVGTSSLNVHFGRNLSNEEADGLSNKKWKYGWEVPAIDMPNCKWKGTGECFIKDEDTNLASEVKSSLYQHWLNIYKTNGGNDFKSKRLFFSLCNSYRDILHCNKKPFYHKGGHGEDSNIVDAYLMHSLNHVLKTGDTVKKNDSKLSKNEKSGNDELLYNDCFRDQGFTRPKILILLPLRSIGFRVIKRLLHLTPSNCKVNVEHMDRFCDEFGSDAAEDAEENDALSKQTTSKPSDFRALFGGNNDDHFMIGIKFTKKSIKLFSDFHTSDIIVASPLGLITKIGEAEREKEKDVDYLTSIEILIIDHADVIAMQNWSHVDTVIQQLNKLPLTQSKTDINRIRHWYYDGHARFYRQSIILSNYLNPEMNALFNRHFVNYAGKVKLVCDYKGVLPKVLLQVRQIYERFEAKSIEDASDARLEYFSKKVFPKIKDSVQGGIMLFISSYFEFVRVRNFLKSQNASICLLGEYTRQSDISRSRIWFFEGKRKMMLYTERAHFYHRYKIRGIRNLIIYSLPERKEFYPEIVNMLDGSDNMTCTVLFSHFDQLRLERIVGSSASKRMITSEKGVFVFC